MEDGSCSDATQVESQTRGRGRERLRSGRRPGQLRNTLALQKKFYENGLQSPYSVAETDSLLGNKQEALQYLKVAYDKHDDSMVRLESDPAFANLNHEPAYQDLVAKLGFPARN